MELVLKTSALVFLRVLISNILGHVSLLILGKPHFLLTVSFIFGGLIAFHFFLSDY